MFSTHKITFFFSFEMWCFWCSFHSSVCIKHFLTYYEGFFPQFFAVFVKESNWIRAPKHVRFELKTLEQIWHTHINRKNIVQSQKKLTRNEIVWMVSTFAVVNMSTLELVFVHFQSFFEVKMFQKIPSALNGWIIRILKAFSSKESPLKSTLYAWLYQKGGTFLFCWK